MPHWSPIFSQLISGPSISNRASGSGNHSLNFSFHLGRSRCHCEGCMGGSGSKVHRSEAPGTISFIATPNGFGLATPNIAQPMAARQRPSTFMAARLEISPYPKLTAPNPQKPHLGIDWGQDQAKILGTSGGSSLKGSSPLMLWRNQVNP